MLAWICHPKGLWGRCWRKTKVQKEGKQISHVYRGRDKLGGRAGSAELKRACWTWSLLGAFEKPGGERNQWGRASTRPWGAVEPMGRSKVPARRERVDLAQKRREECECCKKESFRTAPEGEKVEKGSMPMLETKKKKGGKFHEVQGPGG